MKLSAISGVLLLGLSASGAMAQDGVSPTDAAIRAWVLNNPEVIIESLRGYDERQLAAAEKAQTTKAVLLRDQIAEGAPVLGNPNGSFEVQIFSDYRCPHCRSTHAALKGFIADRDDVRVVVREWPILGQDSVLAARYALAIDRVLGQEAYAAASDRLFAAGGRINKEWIERDLQALGARSGEVHAALVEGNSSIGEHLEKGAAIAREIGINGTPYVIIGQKAVGGAVGMADLEAAYAEAKNPDATTDGQP